MPSANTGATNRDTTMSTPDFEFTTLHDSVGTYVDDPAAPNGYRQGYEMPIEPKPPLHIAPVAPWALDTGDGLLWVLGRCATGTFYFKADEDFTYSRERGGIVILTDKGMVVRTEKKVLTVEILHQYHHKTRRGR